MKLAAGFVSGQKAGEALWPVSQHVFLSANVVCVQGHSERERRNGCELAAHVLSL